MDQDTFEQLYRKYYQSLCFFARRLLNDTDVAKELVQDVFLKSWQKKEGLENDPDRVRAFLYQSVKNASLNYLRDTTRRNSLETQWASTQEEIDPDISNAIIEAEVYRDVLHAVSRLPDECRKVIELSMNGSKTSEEIAELLGISASTVRNQKRRGLQLMRQLLNFQSFLVFLSMFKQHP
ncbi:RNA polymerase sigma-70 factor, ECF subfamily [Chitinophaga sp. CF118]|uniref:RNA polymerase sigma factor n=1 Tax=Chitinophaga sp. CF118 TaxID=1884367 RepID=UPI0008EDC01E|nr:RNA polymerase sigma-70 factor [Chitinophaga sp. CF118]SFE09613.1 RNA polymerase sigma-70 factor, ECF subfamily [Chitinophaga sp. CF118]